MNRQGRDRVRPPRPGDVIEMAVSDGLAYAQVTHRTPSYGTLIRVFEPIYPLRPPDLEELARSQVRFSTFFPVAAALNKGVVALAGSASLPNTGFPLLRQRGAIDLRGHVSDWWLWDGERKWRIGRLAPEQTRLSIAEIMNYTILKQRIETNWRPEQVA